MKISLSFNIFTFYDSLELYKLRRSRNEAGCAILIMTVAVGCESISRIFL